MGFSDEDIRKVREATDLVALIGERVVLKPRNREFWGNCPFHNEKTPSFKVDPGSQYYHCFGCGESGDAINFLRKIDGLEFSDAVRYLAERANIELKETGFAQTGRKVQLYKVMEKTVAFYHQQLMRVKTPEADQARSYLGGRELGGQVAKDWQLGYAPGRLMLVSELTKAGFKREDLIDANVAVAGKDGRLKDRFYERVIFPINDQQGRPIALGGRIMGSGEPKYLNTSDTTLFSKGTTLYALDKAKAQITATATAIVVEGYTDTIAMHRAGFTNTVATLGTALTLEHIKTLARFARKLIYLFDGDAAGQRAADRAASLITREITPESGARPIELLVVVLPDGMDPADFLAQPAADMKGLLANAESLLRFTIDRRLKAFDLKRPEQRQLALADALQVLLPIRGSILATDYLNYLADTLSVHYETVAESYRQLKAPKPQQQRGDGQVENDKEQAAAVGFRIKDDPALSLERELLSYYIKFPELREKMSDSLARIPWQAELHQNVAASLLGAQADESAAQLAALLLDTFTQTADQIAEILASADDAIDPEKAYRQVLIAGYSLRIKQYEREIRAKRAKLSNMSGDAPEHDELFAQIIQLQDELLELRQRFGKVTAS